ncbi:uncharacterized protein LAJ45_08859 [Morchella importuna]|nr:uncharacterized protein LAJ45_08859 [Morchella importuna]KAH8147060.1 hypothetical protein LAJ45_08859 [Morchella importuna]
MQNLTADCARVILTQITNTSFVEACEIALDTHHGHSHSEPDINDHHGHGYGHGHGDDMMDHVEHYTPSISMNVILFVIALLSFLASLVIVLSCKFMRSMRYYRHKVLPGLATSDMLLSLNFLFSTAFQMSGRVINQQDHPKLCSTSGFLTQLFVVQTDYWALTIAINTWIMVGWGGKYAKFIRDSVGVIWAIPWLLSITCASVSLALVGYGDVGAWCWFQNDGMSLFINYIPRWTIVFVIMTIYISLFRYITKSSDFDTDDMEFHRRIRERDDTMVRGGGESFAEAPVNYQATEKDLRAASFRMMKYPLAWAVVWIIPTCVHVYHASGERWGTPQWLTILEKACVASQGLIHCIVFSFTEDVWEHVGDNWISMGGVTEMSWNRDVDEAEMYRQRTPDIVELPPMAGGMF